MVDYLLKRDLVILGYESKMRKGEKLLLKELEPDMPTGRLLSVAEFALHHAAAGLAGRLIARIVKGTGTTKFVQGPRAVPVATGTLLEVIRGYRPVPADWSQGFTRVRYIFWPPHCVPMHWSTCGSMEGLDLWRPKTPRLFVRRS